MVDTARLDIHIDLLTFSHREFPEILAKVDALIRFPIAVLVTGIVERLLPDAGHLVHFTLRLRPVVPVDTPVDCQVDVLPRQEPLQLFCIEETGVLADDTLLVRCNLVPRVVDSGTDFVEPRLQFLPPVELSAKAFVVAIDPVARSEFVDDIVIHVVEVGSLPYDLLEPLSLDVDKFGVVVRDRISVVEVVVLDMFGTVLNIVVGVVDARIADFLSMMVPHHK